VTAQAGESKGAKGAKGAKSAKGATSAKGAQQENGRPAVPPPRHNPHDPPTSGAAGSRNTVPAHRLPPSRFLSHTH